jgi:cob(I)alamin adenosyltransferase
MAVRINRVYTRTGDKGETGLVGGKRVSKDSDRIEAYGTIDELNATLGVVRTINDETSREKESRRFLDQVLRKIQEELFDLGAELAIPPDFAYQGKYRVGEKEVQNIEAIIDNCQQELEPLRSFILPGGGKVGAYLHLCRTVCRRAERQIVRLGRSEKVNEWLIKYVNRLSDLFFVLARWIAKRSGEKEYLWQRGLEESPRKKPPRRQ